MVSVLAVYFWSILNSQGMKGSPQYCCLLVAVILALSSHAGPACKNSEFSLSFYDSKFDLGLTVFLLICH